MLSVDRFYLLSHVFISFIGAILLLALWYNIRRRFRKVLEEGGADKRVDKGMAHLSAALLVWVLAGIWTYFCKSVELKNNWFYGVDSQLSTFNNLFLLMALTYFSKAPDYLTKNEKVIKNIFGLIATVSLLSAFLFYFFDSPFTE